MKHVVLHIGTHKTGTSSLQHFWSINAHKLLAKGVLYPVTGRQDLDGGPSPRHAMLSWRLARRPDLQQALAAEIEAAEASTIILSSETFSSYASLPRLLDNLEALARILEGCRVSVAVFLRHQPDFMASFHNMKVRIGNVSEPMRGFLENELRGNTAQYDYLQLLAPWREAFGDQALRIGFYDRNFLRDRDIFATCMDLAGLDMDPAYDTSFPPQNTSLGPLALEVTRILNAHAQPHSRELFLEQLREVVGPDDRAATAAMLPQDLARRIHERFEDSNRQVLELALQAPDKVFAFDPGRYRGLAEAVDPARVHGALAALSARLWDTLLTATAAHSAEVRDYQARLQDSLALLKTVSRRFAGGPDAAAAPAAPRSAS